MESLKEHNFADYFNHYISLVKEENFLKALKISHKEVKKAMKNITEEQGNFAYAKKKWTIKELLVHIIDTERIFCERALRFARQDKTELPGFDHDLYVLNSGANQRTLKDILKEYKAVRKSTLTLFSNFNEKMLNQSGTANGNKLTVLSIAYIISGHELHHLNILKEKYLTV
ncbi:MAG: DinB family protein [Flavobacteriales bacterium]|nr:DinB family protein [Flavobacteriales bacterium]